MPSLLWWPTMKRLVVLLALSALSGGCATYSVSTIKDTADGSTIYRVDGFPVGYPLKTNIGNLYFRPQKIVRPNGSKEYGVYVEYRGENRLFIEKGETLQVNVDGRIRRYSGEGSKEGREADPSAPVSAGGETVTEAAYYPIALDELREMSFGHEIFATLQGKIIQVTGKFTSGNRDVLSRFVAEHGDIRVAP